MVRCDPDRGHHPGVSLIKLVQASVSPVPGGVHPEQLRERSRTAIAHGAPGSAYSVADPSTGGLRSQAIRLRSRSRGPALPIAPASDSTQLGIAPGISDKPRLLPLSSVPRPSTGLTAPEPPAARRPTPPWSVSSIKKPRMPWTRSPALGQPTR